MQYSWRCYSNCSFSTRVSILCLMSPKPLRRLIRCELNNDGLFDADISCSRRLRFDLIYLILTRLMSRQIGALQGPLLHCTLRILRVHSLVAGNASSGHVSCQEPRFRPPKRPETRSNHDGNTFLTQTGTYAQIRSKTRSIEATRCGCGCGIRTGFLEKQSDTFQRRRRRRGRRRRGGIAY